MKKQICIILGVFLFNIQTSLPANAQQVCDNYDVGDALMNKKRLFYTQKDLLILWEQDQENENIDT